MEHYSPKYEEPANEKELIVKGMDNLINVLATARSMAYNEKINVKFTHNGRTCTIPYDIAHLDLRGVLKNIDKMGMGEVLTAEEVRKIVTEK